MGSYSLTINRYNIHLKFDTLEALRAEVSRYFTVSEKSIVARLTNFNKPKNKDGYVENNYQDFKTCWYED